MAVASKWQRKSLDIILENLERATQNPGICVEEQELLIEEGNRRCEEGECSSAFFNSLNMLEVQWKRSSADSSFGQSTFKSCMTSPHNT